MTFKEGDMIIKGFFPDRAVGLSLFVDIKKWNLKKEQYENYGYAALPVLKELDTDANEETSEFYVMSGVFSLPVFDGTIDPTVLEALKQSTNPAQHLNELAMKGINGVKYKGKTSIIIRMVDQQRKLHFHNPIDREPPSVQYIYPSKAKDLIYKKGPSGTKLSSLVAKKYQKNAGELYTVLKKQFKEYFGL
mmetsp:Transcript_24184/g.37202  ORF Transcript_24184/g.37202 Transcript_24184/m.37202 type:complete len:191 (+) Transcript_24184:4623-5195(+)